MNTKQYKRMKSYEERARNLRSLGFRSYREYLDSDLWNRIKRLVYKQKGSSCMLCGEPATELHHNRYHRNDLLGKKTKYISPICRNCHRRIEFDGDEKVSVPSARREFRKARKNNLKRRPILPSGVREGSPKNRGGVAPNATDGDKPTANDSSRGTAQAVALAGLEALPASRGGNGAKTSRC